MFTLPLTTVWKGLKNDREAAILLQEELNVKKITWKAHSGDLVVEFDTTLTPELEAEGLLRGRLLSAFGDAQFLRDGLPAYVDGNTFEGLGGP